MKYTNALKTIVVFLLAAFSAEAKEGIDHFTLLAAMKEQKVRVCAEALGGHSKQCLYLNIANNTSVPMNITIDPAMIFRPVDSSQQDLVVMGEQVIVLAPNESKSMSVNAFCGKSYASSPRRNTKFNFLKQGSRGLIEAAKFINRHKLYNYIGQAAVWSFTNNKSLSNIYSTDPAYNQLSNELVKLISKMTGKPIPEYNTVLRTYREGASGPVYNPEISRLYVDLNWTNKDLINMHVLVFKSDGTLYKEIKDGERISPKGHSLRVEFDPKKDPHDTYTVCLKDNENYVYLKKRVIVSSESE